MSQVSSEIEAAATDDDDNADNEFAATLDVLVVARLSKLDESKTEDEFDAKAESKFESVVESRFESKFEFEKVDKAEVEEAA